MMEENLTLDEYYTELEKHDWFYEYSDDHRVWRNGQAAHSRLASIAKLSEDHAKLWKEFNEHVFSGKPWGTENKPKPERPNAKPN